MYFNEFKQLALTEASDLFLAIYDTIYQCIPCANNFLVMRENYKQILQSKAANDCGISFVQYTQQYLVNPVLDKMVGRIMNNFKLKIISWGRSWKSINISLRTIITNSLYKGRSNNIELIIQCYRGSWRWTLSEAFWGWWLSQTTLEFSSSKCPTHCFQDIFLSHSRCFNA